MASNWRQCIYCPQRYQRGGRLNNHYRLKHQGQPVPRIADHILIPRQLPLALPINEPLPDAHILPLIGGLPFEQDPRNGDHSDDDDDDNYPRHLRRDDIRDYEQAFAEQLVGPWELGGPREESPEPQAPIEAEDQIHIEPFPQPCALTLGRVDDTQLLRIAEENPWAPFLCSDDYKLARHFVRTQTPKTSIDAYFNDGIQGNRAHSYSSGHTLWQQLRLMGNSLPKWSQGNAPVGKDLVPFYERDALEAIQFLLRQRAYKNALIFEPQKHHSPDGRRIYTEMNTSDWWHDKQVEIGDGGTVVPVICASDKCQLTAFSGDKKAWPIYLTIGNIRSDVRNQPSQHSYIVIALLPIAPKKKLKESTADIEVRKQQMTANVRGVISHVLRSLREIGAEGIRMECGDGYFRQCWPILACWIADHPEHTFLQSLKANACPQCTTDWRYFGSYFSADELLACRRSEQTAVELYDSYLNHDITKKQLGQQGMLPQRGLLWGYPHTDAYDLHRPDVLHTIQIGVLQHLMTWIDDFLAHHRRLPQFDRAWKSTSSYPGFVRPTKAYREVEQWSGKEMRMLAHILLPCLAAALSEPTTPDERTKFAQALRCVQSFITFHLYSLYRSHDDDTLRCMDDALQQFHDEKEVFRQYRRKVRTEAIVEERRKRLQRLRERKVSRLGRDRGTKTQRDKLRRKLTRKDEERIDELRHELGDFDFIKMHLLGHFTASIRRSGPVINFSTEVAEQSHRIQLKKPFHRSNKNSTHQQQMLNDDSRSYALTMRELTLRQLASEGHNTPDILTTLHLLPADVRRAVAKHHRTGAPIPPMVFNPLLDNANNSTLNPRRTAGSPKPSTTVALECTRLADNNHSLTWYVRRYYRELGHVISDDDTNTIQLQLYGCLHIPVVRLHPHIENDHVIHTVRCTMDGSWRDQPKRNDYVIIKDADDAAFGAMRGHRVAQLVRLMKLIDGSAHPRMCALVRPFDFTNGGDVEPHHNLVRLRQRHTAQDLWIVNFKCIIMAAHIVPETYDSDDNAKTWLLNSTVDLKSWNTFY